MGRSSRLGSGHTHVLHSTTCSMSNGIGACSRMTHQVLQFKADTVAAPLGFRVKFR